MQRSLGEAEKQEKTIKKGLDCIQEMAILIALCLQALQSCPHLREEMISPFPCAELSEQPTGIYKSEQTSHGMPAEQTKGHPAGRCHKQCLALCLGSPAHGSSAVLVVKPGKSAHPDKSNVASYDVTMRSISQGEGMHEICPWMQEVEEVTIPACRDALYTSTWLREEVDAQPGRTMLTPRTQTLEKCWSL